MGYYNDLETKKLIASPQFTQIFDYDETIEGELTEDKLLDLGVYIQDGIYVKYFDMSIDGKSTSVMWRMRVEKQVGQDAYIVRPRGVAIDSSLSDFIDSASAGFGYEIDSATNDDIRDEILELVGTVEDLDPQRMIINGVIDIYGRSVYDYTILDVMYNYFERFPNIDNPYTFIQRPLPPGENFIIDYDHSTFINNNVASNNNGNLTPTYTPKQMKIMFDKLYEDSELFRNILGSSQIVRICYRQVAPTILSMYINGYTLDNAKVVATNETESNQIYGGLIKHCIGGKFETNYIKYGDNEIHLDDEWDIDMNISQSFYNYIRTDFFSTHGLTTGEGTLGSGKIIDSIGSSVAVTPVNPITNNHNKWYDPNGYVPVGHKPIDPSVPSIDIQSIVRGGEPPVEINPRPVQGVTPYPDIDDPSPSTLGRVPTDDVGGANMYHPTIWEMNSFYGWLWDRETWRDKKDMHSDPLESIISYHTLPLPDDLNWFSTVTKPLVLGYLHAKVEGYYDAEGTEGDIKSYSVPNRYVEYNFGKVNIPRTYRDYRDFDREIYIYLPYIGFKQLRCDDVTGYKYYSSVDVYLIYRIDIATGDFVAEISINKNQADRKVLYTFNGNMATEKPITATDKSRMMQARWAGLAGIATTVLGGGMFVGGVLSANPSLMYSGGAMALGGIGATGSALNTYSNQNVVSVERSSGLSGNFGAMGGKTPYIVINALIPFDTNYAPYSGDSSNVTIQLGQLSGFTKCKYVHVDTLASATTQEKEEIEALLLSGVIL